MNSDFPRILTLLRKERGYSQKKVASDLGISQALLSHYEKGIRECGLDFVVRTADYYDVSCDYLLGRTPQRNGSMIAVNDLPSNAAKGRKSRSAPWEYQHRILLNTLHIVFALLKKINSESLAHEVSLYLSLALYKTFRVLYSSNSKNPQGLFKLDPRMFGATVDAGMSMAEAKTRYVLSGESIGTCKGVEWDAIPRITPETLTKDYPQHAPALFELIVNTEKSLDEER